MLDSSNGAHEFDRSELDALSHQPQRRMLIQLADHNPADDIPDDIEDLEVEDEDLETLLDFQHYHLPQLEQKGFVEYDREDHVVTKGPQFDEIKPLIELIDDHLDELPDDWL